MTKSALRRHYLAQRRSLSAENIERRSIQITDQLFATFFAKTPPGSLHTYLPNVRQKEVNTWPIIYRIWHDFPSVQVIVPVTDMTTNQLIHYVLTANTPLLENRWGINEPELKGGQIITDKQVDMVLVPLLAFDKQGHRVGYGKGFYDRFLAECRPDCLKIGLSLFEPTEQIADIEPTDVQLDFCVTPEHIFYFNSF